jgi:hypothetical protein
VGCWDLAKRCYEPGAWLGGRIFPRRSDLSPDGRLLCYFAHKPSATWEHGEAYVALSKLPWLTALYAFATCGTWTRGYYFTEDGSWDEPEHAKLPIPYGLRSIPVVQFANERRRGWEETPDSLQRDPKDFWDQRRNARMQKRQPGGNRLLCVESLGWAGGEFGAKQAIDGLRTHYWLEFNGGIELLDDLQWADWDREDNCWSPLVLESSKSGISTAMAPKSCSKKIFLFSNQTPPLHRLRLSAGSRQLPFDHDEWATLFAYSSALYQLMHSV